jgi:tRNA pseudouridine55 synthase
MDYIPAKTESFAINLETGALLPVDKPLQWTSFDVVAKIRNTLRSVLQQKRVKVGHSGTLDPLATGLLLIAVGKATRSIETLTGLPKTYSGTMKLGAWTNTYDAEGEERDPCDVSHLSLTDVKKHAAAFEGEIEQQVPAYSAVKVGGQALYKKARAGIAFEAPSRRVTVYAFEITAMEGDFVHFFVSCSKGTYIRSLAHDLGQALGCGAYLQALRRESIGEYAVGDAWALDSLIEKLKTTI